MATPEKLPRNTCPAALIQLYRYEQWLRWLPRFHRLRHPWEMGSGEVTAFLTHLAVEGQGATPARTKPDRRCWFCAVRWRENWIWKGVVRTRAKRRLLAGSGLRLMEALR